MSVVDEQVGVHNRRFVVELDDGSRVESVLYRADTLCVSSQVGCAVRCVFCASGARGLARNLALGELVSQVEAVEARGHAIARVTVSGIGEPLHNDEVVRAFVAWCRGRPVRPLRTSVTTSGATLRRLCQWLLEVPHNGLTISVHAGTEPVRAALVPHGPTLGTLFDALRDAGPAMSRSRRKKTALAYLAIAGANDSDAEVDAFIARAAPLGLAIHLYAYNPVATSACSAVSRRRYEQIYARMSGAGLVVRMSSRARIEANGGCGTLVALGADRSRAVVSRAEGEPGVERTRNAAGGLGGVPPGQWGRGRVGGM